MKHKIYAWLKENFLYFMAYSIIGWIYEVFLEVVVYKWGFTNRGVLFGPYCPVYGFGMLIFLLTVYRIIKDKPLKMRIVLIPVVFVFCALIATAVELVASYFCELIIGSWPWQTYADYTYNFQARIALSPSIRFGLGGVLLLYVIQPIFEKTYKHLKVRTANIIFYVMSIIVLLDMVYSFFISKLI